MHNGKIDVLTGMVFEDHVIIDDVVGFMNGDKSVKVKVQ